MPSGGVASVGSTTNGATLSSLNIVRRGSKAIYIVEEFFFYRFILHYRSWYFAVVLRGPLPKKPSLADNLPAGATEDDVDEDEDKDEDENDSDYDNNNDNDEDDSDGKGEVIRGQHKRKLFIRKTILCI